MYSLGSNNSNNGCDNSDHFPMRVCVCVCIYIWILDSNYCNTGCNTPDHLPMCMCLCVGIYGFRIPATATRVATLQII